LSDAECKTIYPNSYSDQPSGGYIQLDDTCWDDAENRKFRQLVKSVKDAQVTYAVNPHKMELVELITQSEAARIKKELGIKGRNSDNDHSRQDRANAAKEEKNRKKVLCALITAISDKVKEDGKMSFMCLFAEAVLRASSFDAKRIYVQQRDPKVKGDQVYDELKKHLDSLKLNNELLAFSLSLLMIDEAAWRGYGETATALAKLYGIDIKKIAVAIKKEG
jgi:hypothetical protein